MVLDGDGDALRGRHRGQLGELAPGAVDQLRPAVAGGVAVTAEDRREGEADEPGAEADGDADGVGEIGGLQAGAADRLDALRGEPDAEGGQLDFAHAAGPAFPELEGPGVEFGGQCQIALEADGSGVGARRADALDAEVICQPVGVEAGAQLHVPGP